MAQSRVIGKDFVWAFGRPWTQAYDLIVAMLCGVAALLALANRIDSDTSALMLYDFWFLLAGSLFVAVAAGFRRRHTPLPSSEAL